MFCDSVINANFQIYEKFVIYFIKSGTTSIYKIYIYIFSFCIHRYTNHSTCLKIKIELLGSAKIHKRGEIHLVV